jgi:hypothetical protein
MRGYMGVQNNPRLTRGAPPPMIWLQYARLTVACKIGFILERTLINFAPFKTSEPLLFALPNTVKRSQCHQGVFASNTPSFHVKYTWYLQRKQPDTV